LVALDLYDVLCYKSNYSNALPSGPGPGHPESLTADLRPEDEELLAATEDENFPES
jgi:hypothetical protein